MADKKSRGVISLVLAIIMMTSLMGMGALAVDDTAESVHTELSFSEAKALTEGGTTASGTVTPEVKFDVTINLCYMDLGDTDWTTAASHMETGATESTFDPATRRLTDYSEFSEILFSRGGSVNCALNNPSSIGIKVGGHEYGLDASVFAGGIVNCSVYINGRGVTKGNGITAEKLAEIAKKDADKSVTIDYYFTQIVHISVDNGYAGGITERSQIFSTNSKDKVVVNKTLTDINGRGFKGWKLNGEPFVVPTGGINKTICEFASAYKDEFEYDSDGQLWCRFVSQWDKADGSVTISKEVKDTYGNALNDGTFTYDLVVGTEHHEASITTINGTGSVTVEDIPNGTVTVNEKAAAVSHYDFDDQTVTDNDDSTNLAVDKKSIKVIVSDTERDAHVTFSATYKTNEVKIFLYTLDLGVTVYDTSAAATVKLSDAELNNFKNKRIDDSIIKFDNSAEFTPRNNIPGFAAGSPNYSLNGLKDVKLWINDKEYGLDGDMSGKQGSKDGGKTYSFYFAQIVHYGVDGGPATLVTDGIEQVFTTNSTVGVTVPAAPASADYNFEGWTVNGKDYTGSDEKLLIKEADSKLNAYTPTYTGYNGSELWFNFVSQWSINTASTNAVTITITPTANTTVIGDFTYEITGKDYIGYTIAPITVTAPASVSVIKGSYTVTQKTPAPTATGYTWDNVKLNDTSGDSRTYSVNSDITVTAENTYKRDIGSVTITVKQEGEEKDTQQRSYTFTLTDADGGEHTANLTVDSGETTGSVTIDSVPIGAFTVTDGTTTAPSGLTVEKEKTSSVSYTYTYDAAPGGGGAPAVVVPPFVGPADPADPVDPADPTDPVDIEDGDVPEGDTPVDIGDGDVPLGDTPVNIGHGKVPLGESPITGDNSLMTILAMTFLASFSGLVLIWLAATRKKYSGE